MDSMLHILALLVVLADPAPRTSVTCRLGYAPETSTVQSKEAESVGGEDEGAAAE